MSVLDYGWNGSTVTFNSVAVAPLTDLHQPNDPADFDTTGSTDTTHLHGTGLPKNSFSASCLGSNIPVAGKIVNIAASIAGGGATTPVTKSYAEALITQMSVSGRKDGRIESSFTAMPGVSSLSAITYANSIADLGFNGSSFSFGGTAFTGLISANYTSSATPVECSGANDTDNLFRPGIVDETLTIVALGGPQCLAKATGAAAMSWNDGGSVGTTVGSYTTECVSTHPGGTLDGQTTTEYVFKMRRTGSGNS